MNEQSVRCPICGTPARGGARFCTSCGADLAAAVPQLPPMPAAPALPPGDDTPTVPRQLSEAPTVAYRPGADADSITLTGMQAIRQRALRQNSGTATHAGRVRSHNEDYVA